MKRTLVERVAQWLFNDARHDGELSDHSLGVQRAWKREARRIIAMVRRHDRKEKGK